MAAPITYEDPCSITSPRVHVKIKTEATTLRYGVIPLRDGSSLGGYKEPRVLKIGTIARSASDPVSGAWSAQTASLSLADTDRELRRISDTRGGLRNSDVEIYLTSNSRRIAGGAPRVLFAGKAYSDQANENLTMNVQVNDVIGIDYSLFSDEKQLPQRVISRVDFVNAPDAAIGKGAPIIMGNVSNPTPGGAGVVTGIYIGRATFGFETSTLTTPPSGGDATTLAAVVAALQASVTAGSVVSDYGGRIGYDDAATLQGLGTVPSDYDGLAAVIGYDDLDALISGQNASTTTSSSTTTPVEYEMVVIAGHAIKELKTTTASGGGPSIWLNDVVVAAADLGVSVFAPAIPGDTTWATTFGSAKYTDVIGSDGQTRRYTIIFFKVGTAHATTVAGGAKVAVECIGLETVGDGSGTAITDLFDQYLHVLTNFGLQDYASGSWLPIPTFTLPDGTTLARLNSASFAAAKAVGVTQLSTGYIGGGVIGAGGARKSIRQVVADFNVSGACSLAQNDYGQLGIGKLSTSRTTVLADPWTAVAHRTLKDKIDFLPGMSIQPKPDWQINTVGYEYAENYSNSTFGRQFGSGGASATSVQDKPSQLKYGILEKMFTFKFIRDDATATVAAEHYLALFKNPPKVVTYRRRGLCGLEDDLLMGVPITHFNGYGKGGWRDHAVWILSKVFDPSTMTCTFEALDIEGLIPATTFTPLELRNDPTANSGIQADGSSVALYSN